MRKSPVLIGGWIAAALVLLPLARAADPAGKDVIEYRQHIMTAMNEQAAILGQIAAYSAPRDNLGAHLDTMALLASTALKSFEPKVPGGQSEPEVWSKWDDFSKRMRTFAGKTREAAQGAHTAGPDAALANMLDVLDCKNCHLTYRDETK